MLIKGLIYCFSLFLIGGNLFSAMDPEVSFDGKKILFTGKKKKTDHWQIWEMDIDGTDNMGYLTNNVIGSYKRMVKISTDRRVYFIENKTNSFFGGKLSYVLEKRPLHSYKVLNSKDKGYFYSVFPTY